jgi:hypothetical protein
MNGRVVAPELLDSLPPTDPAAIRSRADLRRVNWWMGNVRHVTHAIESLPKFPASILEIGAGDGTFMLKVAERLQRRSGREVRLYLLDREPVIQPGTLAAFSRLGWRAEVVHADVQEWSRRGEVVDLVTANLFLHHFSDSQLAEMFQVFSRNCSTFVACEPRRWMPSVVGTRLLWYIGCNRVTLHDADVSVRAGFRERELSSLWPAESGFQVREEPAGFASHLFLAMRTGAN